MIFKAKISQLLYIFVVLLFVSPNLTADNMSEVQTFSKGLETFAFRLFWELTKTNRGRNIVYSPFSIQTCLTMARMGAEGATAKEIDQVLALSEQNTDDLADNYHNILAQYQNSSILKIVNKFYIMEGYKINENFDNLITEKFFSSIEPINFGNNNAAANTINTWVESKTNNLIKNLISPRLLDANSRSVLVNVIHFKGNWVHQFPERATREMDFYLDEINKVKIQMMHLKEDFRYGEFPELDATALELPYKNSDLAMLVILPNSRTGLFDLENKMQNVALGELVERMETTKVIVDMPKFKAEFDAELSQPLKKMGIVKMFTDEAEFGKMLKSLESLKVSSIFHKAFIEVNEIGTEAAAATAMVMMLGSMPMFEVPPKHFNANKPFYYTLHNKEGLVFFEGTLQNF